MKATKKIENTFSRHSKANFTRLKCLNEIYDWIEKQGIDTSDIRFHDAIGVRLQEDE